MQPTRWFDVLVQRCTPTPKRTPRYSEVSRVSSLLRAFHRQPICSDITLVRVVSFDPNELSAAALGLSLFQLVSHLLDEILVFYGPGTCHPTITLPVDVPLGNTLDRVLAVGANFNILGEIDCLKGAEDGC